MSQTLNPLAEWLDVRAAEPNHYELLGLPLFENDAELIRSSYLERYGRVRQYQVGPYSDQALRLLDELSDAFRRLDNSTEKQQYDEQLRKKLGARTAVGKSLSLTALGAMERATPLVEFPTAKSMIEDELVKPAPAARSRSVAARLKGLPVQFDRGLRRLLGEENTLLFHFTRVMLYGALPAVLAAAVWLNVPAFFPGTLDGDNSGTVAGGSASGSSSGARLAPPSAKNQAELSGELDALIAQQIFDELTPEQKQRLAAQVVRLADEARAAPERRFVLLRKAAKLAVEADDVDLMTALASALSEEYKLGVSQPGASWLRSFALAGETGASSGQAENAERAVINSIGMKLVLIPAGQFTMGSPDTERDRDRDETQHPVRITHTFYLAAYETTQQEFQDVLGRNPSRFSSQSGNSKVTGIDTRRFPVEYVSWYEAVDFCNSLSSKEGLPPYYRLQGVVRESDGAISDLAAVEILSGRGYRLPTEAEWEYACRGGATSPFHFGSQLTGREANTNGYSYGADGAGPNLARTAAVGAYSPNAFGLFDLHGNVWEWCQDWYGQDYYATSPADDPTGPASGTFRVLRGGSWFNFPRNARAAYRFRSQPHTRDHNFGFRVARNP
jgi:formylglycine-generating enzyme required for sulfatase activity